MTQPNTPDENRLDLHAQVVDLLAERGIAATIEYPSLVAIEITETEQVWTGHTGWDFGSISCLDEDGGWQPNERENAEPDGLTEDERDPRVLADAWAAWVKARRAATA